MKHQYNQGDREISTIREEARFINRVLRSIRDINQLIVKEKNRQKLIESACKCFTRTRGFNGAWIVLTDRGFDQIDYANSGIPEEPFAAFISKFQEGDLSPCCEKARETSDVCVKMNPAKDCTECPLAKIYKGSAALSAPLQHEDQYYGYIGVSVPKRFINEQEKSLLREVTGDIGFALSAIDQEQRRRQIEEALQQSEREKKSILDAQGEHVILQDPDLTIRWPNKAACDSAGMSRHELTGRRCYEIWAEEDSPCDDCPVLEAMETGEAQEIEKTTPDGQSWYIRGYPLRDARGNITGGVEVTHNITNRKKMEAQLKETNEELAETLRELRETQQQVVTQERHRALSQMASSIAHDFNNALSTIRGFSDLLLESEDKLDDRESTKRYLEHIRKAASNAAETVRRMRKFYRPREDQEFTSLDLNSIIEETISMTKPRWKEEARAQSAEIKVQKDLGQLDEIAGNEAELYEALTNFVFNAVDAMPDGGTLTFRTRQKEDNIVLEVQDTGVGMPEEVRRHCLDPFFTTKGETGTGLGLSTVSGTVKRHDGHITVESRENQGTTFRIRLPVRAISETAKENGEAPEGKTPPLKILVVEDEKDQRELLTQYLELDGHKVDVKQNGNEGLRTFMNGYYDLVITDRSMPEISGDVFAARVKKEAPQKPVIMLTGFGDMMEAAGEDVPGVEVLLSKPVTLDQLREALIKVMNRNERQGS
ncbi:MAG: ATP-binding protein [Candidatus Brocadiia bacterium]